VVRPLRGVPRHDRINDPWPLGLAAPGRNPVGADRVDAPPDTLGVTQPDFVAQGIGERLAGVVADDSVPREVQCGVQIDELHRTTARQHAEHDPSERPPPQPGCVGMDRRERGTVVHRGPATVAVGDTRVQLLPEGGELGEQSNAVGRQGLGLVVELIEVAEQLVPLDLEVQPTAPRQLAGEPHHRHVEVVVTAAPCADNHRWPPRSGIGRQGEHRSRGSTSSSHRALTATDPAHPSRRALRPNQHHRPPTTSISFRRLVGNDSISIRCQRARRRGGGVEGWGVSARGGWRGGRTPPLPVAPARGTPRNRRLATRLR